jgi:hypothetical protein
MDAVDPPDGLAGRPYPRDASPPAAHVPGQRQVHEDPLARRQGLPGHRATGPALEMREAPPNLAPIHDPDGRESDDDDEGYGHAPSQPTVWPTWDLRATSPSSCPADRSPTDHDR